jgi:hypothetical protein
MYLEKTLNERERRVEWLAPNVAKIDGIEGLLKLDLSGCTRIIPKVDGSHAFETTTLESLLQFIK